jgi:hypothetical protein
VVETQTCIPEQKFHIRACTFSVARELSAAFP